MSAESDLRLDQIQDLAEVLGELQAAAMPDKLRFHVRIELGGDQGVPRPEVVARVNEVLKEALSGVSVQLS